MTIIKSLCNLVSNEALTSPSYDGTMIIEECQGDQVVMSVEIYDLPLSSVAVKLDGNVSPLEYCKK